MTVSYNLDVTKNSWRMGIRLLMRWKGSIWKSVWRELLLWLFMYYIVFFLYRFVMQGEIKLKFEALQFHLRKNTDWIPLNVLLGFFVTMVLDRWRALFQNLGYIENVAHAVATLFVKKDDSDVYARRAIIRYLCLAQVLVMRDISVKVRKRFPNLDAVVKAGFMEKNERFMYENVHCSYHKFWVPVNWACSIAMQARQKGVIGGDNYLSNFYQEIKNFRSQLQQLSNLDWVPLPLAYPQLVICITRIYFLLCIVSRQFIITPDAENRSRFDMVFPILTVLQFCFYIGWSKVAESLLNPMGEDDDHFECNYLIDRNIQVGLSIVDDTFGVVPTIGPDRFKNDRNPHYPSELFPSKDFTPGGGDGYTAFKGSLAHILFAKDDDSIDMKKVPVMDPPALDRSQDLKSGTTPLYHLTSIRQRINSTSRRASKDISSRSQHNALPPLPSPPCYGNLGNMPCTSTESVDTTDFPCPFKHSDDDSLTVTVERVDGSGCENSSNCASNASTSQLCLNEIGVYKSRPPHLLTPSASSTPPPPSSPARLSIRIPSTFTLDSESESPGPLIPRKGLLKKQQPSVERRKNSVTFNDRGCVSEPPSRDPQTIMKFPQVSPKDVEQAVAMGYLRKTSDVVPLDASHLARNEYGESSTTPRLFHSPRRCSNFSVV